MKKSSFVALVLGTVSGVLFALGMCMALLPEWNSFRPGVILGALGIVMGVVTWLIWRRMENKEPIRLSGKAVLTVAVSIVGTLALGIGLCFILVWSRLVPGILIGLLGLLALLSVIPLVKGLR